MQRRCWILASTLSIALTIVACSVAEPPLSNGSEDAPPPATWKRTMHRLGEHFDILETELDKQPSGDLRAVASAATAGAALLRHGYGKFENKKVENFGRMARDAESWLLRIAAEAGQANGPIAQDLFRGGEARYCTRCHDASKARQW